MKIKTIKLSYSELQKRKPKKFGKPKKVLWIWKALIRLISFIDLKKVKFKVNKINIDKLNKKEPWFILMNHSSFIDLEIAYSVLYKKKFNVVATTDAFVGKNWLMRQIGCMPTVKFIVDPMLVRGIINVAKQKRSILMFPEVGYTFDGTTTTLPFSLAKMVKFLKIPLVTIITHGAHLRQPLFNKLRKRKIQVTCDYKYVLSVDQINQMSEQEIFDVILKEFSFNEYNYQIQNNIIINEKERADNLNAILYKCPHCGTEGKMKGHDHVLECEHCSTVYELKENGKLYCINNETKFDTIPKWYKFEREEVKKEIKDRTYKLETEVDVIAMKDTYSLYEVGTGYLKHSLDGFTLTLDDGSLTYHQDSTANYSINADIYWYQLGDIICVGDYNIQFYCLPKKKDVVVKARLATEEIYKKIKEQKEV